jgi:tight adherence protein C
MIQGQIFIYSAYFFIFWSVFYIVRRFLSEQDTLLAQQNFESSSSSSRHFLVKLLKPILQNYIVPHVYSAPFWDKDRAKYRGQLITGGLQDELNADEFISFKILLAFLTPFLLTLGLLAEVISLSWWIVFFSPLLGWFYPHFWVDSIASQRKVQILRSMPFVVDLLALCTESGLDFVGAIGRVAEKANPSALIEELEQVLKEIKLGSSRAVALREMAKRVNLNEINSFVAILIASDQLGAPIGRVLKQQSEQIRNNRLTRAEKEGAKAASKLNLPIFLFVLPAAFLMIIGPVLLGFMYVK